MFIWHPLETTAEGPTRMQSPQIGHSQELGDATRTGTLEFVDACAKKLPVAFLLRS